MSFTILEPDYYSRFACIAADCKLSCCRNWNITFNKKDYDALRSKRIPQVMRDRLRRAVRRIENGKNDQYAQLVLDESGGCPLLCEDLCSLQLACGPDVLPRVCQTYPRKMTRVVDLVVRNCHNSCEAVLQLLLQQKNGVSLCRRAATAQEERTLKSLLSLLPAHILMAYYEPILITVLSILQNRAYPLPQRLLLVGLAAKELDAITEDSLPKAATDWMLKYAALASGNALAAQLQAMPAHLALGVQNCVGNLLELLSVQRRSSLSLVEIIQRLNIQMDQSQGQTVFQVDFPVLERINARTNELLADAPYFMESVLINHVLDSFFPFNMAMEYQIYDSFLGLCSDYAMFRVAMMAYVGHDGDMDQAILGLELAARSLEHNATSQKALVARLHENGADTLAHMAYLVNI